MADDLQLAELSGVTLRSYEHLNNEEDHLLESLRQTREDRDKLKGIAPSEDYALPLSEIIRQQERLGPAIPTGFSAIDQKLRGGVRLQKVIAFLGQPGAGKTTLTTQLGVNAAGRMNVGFVFADEGLGSSCVRVAQQLGHSREDAERGAPHVVKELAEWEQKSGGTFINTNHPRMCTLTVAVEHMLRTARFPNRPHLWIFDSVQTILAREGDVDKDPNERVGAFMDQVRKLVQRHDAIAFVISQANRASWSNKKATDNTNPLAGGMGSAKIEFMSDVVFWLGAQHMPDGPEAFSLMAAKNRIGGVSGHVCALALDRERGLFRETIGEDVVALDQKFERLVVETKVRIIQALRSSPLSAVGLREVVGVGRPIYDRARSELQDEQKIFMDDGGPGRKRNWYAGQPTAEAKK